MIYVMLAVLLLLLTAAGILAYQNSKLIFNRNKTGSSARSASLMYSVYNQAITDQAEDSNAVPLFQWTVPAETAAAQSETKAGTTLTLCRVAAGKGEMVLADAQSWMLNSIRQSAYTGAPMEHEAFLDKVSGSGEKELVMNLEEAVKEEVYRANHH
jgi:hypothetical protein